MDSHARTWRIVRIDGSAVEIQGQRVIITTSGALMVIGSGKDPLYIAGAWIDCTEIKPAHPRQ
jgi:hypothetical protein